MPWKNMPLVTKASFSIGVLAAVVVVVLMVLGIRGDIPYGEMVPYARAMLYVIIGSCALAVISYALRGFWQRPEHNDPDYSGP
jgi:hypothetical protein